MPRHPRLPAPAILLRLLASAGLVVGVLGQSAPPVLPPAAAPAAAEPAASAPAGGGSAASRAGVAAVPECDAVMVISRAKCQFEAVNDDIARVTVGRPIATVIQSNGTDLRSVPFAGNGLRQLLEATFPPDQAKPTSYANPPVVSVIVGSGRSSVATVARLVPSRENSVRSAKQPQRYTLQVQRGPGNDDMAALSAGKCKVYIRAPCSAGCPEGEANFGAGCESACPAGLSDFGAGCTNATATADVCPDGEAKFGSGCEAATATADVYLDRANICDATALTDATQTALCLAVANPTPSECPCGTPDSAPPSGPPIGPDQGDYGDGDGDYPDGCLCDGCC